ncbi:hypothetical protein AAFF_G00209760 [Aldrovandia affinis]|uniref:Uncharacterized protein n=1 Tax=Aldrovandia affinis TaxID=143900 RepID=A0AAD7WUZ0_9TELE|nr:hypothetical protein AAFF_G00209760 [Aldrovandia affinis]
MARRVSAMSGNLADQLDLDLAKCGWFSIQCDESVDSRSTAQLLVFIRMVFDDFSTKEELLTLLPLKTTTRGVDIYNAVKEFFMQKKVVLPLSHHGNVENVFEGHKEQDVLVPDGV